MDKKGILDIMWNNFELVLLDGYVTHEYDDYNLVNTLVSNFKTDPNVSKMIDVIRMFNKDKKTGRYLLPVEIDDVLKTHSGKDREVFLRCLSFNMGNQKENVEIRKYAIARLSFDALWSLLAIDEFPVYSVYEILNRVSRQQNVNMVKILFDLKYEDILKLIDVERERKVSTFFLKYNLTYLPTYLVGVSRNTFVIEDEYYKRIKEIFIRTEKGFEGLGISRNKDLIEIKKTIDFLETAPLEPAKMPDSGHLDQLPLRALNKLSNIRNKLYYIYFVTHPKDEVAMLSMKFIKDSNIAASVLRIRKLNSAVLRTIESRPELMNSYQSKKFLLFNPKSRPEYYYKYSSALTSDDLQKLVRDREANPNIRALARRKLPK